MQWSSTRVWILAAFLAALAACGDEEVEEPAPPVKEAVANATPTTAADAALAPTTETPANPNDFHLDGDQVEYRPARAQRFPESPTIEILLRSTPPDSVASVNGEIIGKTPVLWRGKHNGQNQEFTFVLEGYAVARYRFVPTKNGIVHGTLKRLPAKHRDAGVVQPAPQVSAPKPK